MKTWSSGSTPASPAAAQQSIVATRVVGQLASREAYWDPVRKTVCAERFTCPVGGDHQFEIR
jgi:predicted HD phosphohydrolase